MTDQGPLHPTETDLCMVLNVWVTAKIHINSHPNIIRSLPAVEQNAKYLPKTRYLCVGESIAIMHPCTSLSLRSLATVVSFNFRLDTSVISSSFWVSRVDLLNSSCTGHSHKRVGAKCIKCVNQCSFRKKHLDQKADQYLEPKVLSHKTEHPANNHNTLQPCWGLTCCSVSSVASSFSLCSSRHMSRSLIFSPCTSTWSERTLTWGQSSLNNMPHVNCVLFSG